METLQSKWNEILDFFKKEYDISDISFNAWFKPLQIVKVNGDVVTIAVNNVQMAIDYIKSKYLTALTVSMNEICHHPYQIQLILKAEDEDEDILEEDFNSSIPKEETSYRQFLNPKYTFDNFIVGDNSRLAYAGAVAVAENPGLQYNPLFIYGDVGLGKTHLLHSIAHAILDANPQAKVRYTTSEEFTNELIESIKNGKYSNSAMSKFRDKYRNIDVLIIDDIQFIIGKTGTQEEFFHTFNHLHLAKKQIIISSDRPPREMETLEERLKSRFEWGLPADISSPNYETRTAILRKKAEIDKINLSDEIIDYIANNINSNIRELEGSVNKIIAYSKLENKKIDLELAQRALKDIINPNKKRVLTPEKIIETVAAHFDLEVKDLTGKVKTTEIVIPRQISMYLCRELTDAPLKKIGEKLGNRDHSTVSHGIKKAIADCSYDPNLEKQVEIIKKKLVP